MSKIPFMPLSVGDFVKDTMDLTAEETGAYLLLIMAQWGRSGKSLPSDSERLKRIARVGRSWPKVWSNIGRFFDHDECGVFNEKCRELFHSVASKVEVKKQSGARGGAAKALNLKNTALANARISLEQKPTYSELYSEEEKKEEEPIGSSKKKSPRGSRLSVDWYLPKDWGDWAVSEGLCIDDIRMQADQFQDYWTGKAGAAANKVDWFATWRMWVRKFIADSKGRKNGKPSRAQFDEAHREYTRLLAAGQIHARPDPSDPFAGGQGFRDGAGEGMPQTLL
ncbi:MAG: DUF1376 domain-containing protein [Cypionkella sp.]|nr:DUF1376 domain-containing protein [Cypionkella sp.]